MKTKYKLLVQCDWESRREELLDRLTPRCC